MTGNVIIDLAISVTGIAILVLIARLMFPGAAAVIDQDAAAARLRFDEPDFLPANWAIDKVRGTAIAKSKSGDFALVMVKGADLMTRRFFPDVVSIQYKDGALSVDLREVFMRPVLIGIDEGEAKGWLDCLLTDNIS